MGNDNNNNPDLPPSYFEATTTPTTTTTTNPLPTSTTRTNPLTGLPLPSPLTTHLRTLPARLRTTQLARQTAQAARDLALTARLVPHVEAFLADYDALVSSSGAGSALGQGQGTGGRGRGGGGGGQMAEVTLVPAAAVPGSEGWVLSGAGERGREGEVVRVARVDTEAEIEGEEFGFGEKGGRKVKGDSMMGNREGGEGSGLSAASREAGFDEWGRFDTDAAGGSGAAADLSWWADEGMAHRLASYLRPEPNLERRHVQAAVVEKKAVERERSGWGRLGLGGGRKKSVGDAAGLPSPVSPTPSSPGVGEDDSVKMTVRAEEVTFRRENDFGIWESKTGWGVVVTVRVKP